MPRRTAAVTSPATPVETDLGIVDALAQLTFLVQGLLSEHASSQDLSLPAMRLLGVLRDRTPTMQELARLLELDKSSTTGLVDRAERRGLVRRAPSPADRRSSLVALTATGRRLVSRVAAAFEAEIADVTSCLTATEQQRLSKLATRVVAERARTAASR